MRAEDVAREKKSKWLFPSRCQLRACRASISQGEGGASEVQSVRPEAYLRVVIALMEYTVALCQPAIMALETLDHAQVPYSMIPSGQDHRVNVLDVLTR